ncbi:MAG: sodium ion-translocating decarboxylase subunit beta [Fusobacteriaceae bacterium]
MLQIFLEFLTSTGFLAVTYGDIIMIVISCILLYLAIVKGFEPLLLIPIAFGMLLTNLPLSGMMNSGTTDLKTGLLAPGGLFYYLYQGVKLGIFPPLIFLGVGAMTDFGPLIANPKSLLLGAAAQFGIFFTFFGAIASGLFTAQEAASIGIIGGADGPTAIFLTSKLAPHLLGPIAVAAYSYMALVPIIQPPIMKFLTTKEERMIKMEQLRIVTKKERVIFPVVVTILVSLFVPPATALVGMLMLGNLIRECGVAARLEDTAKNTLINIVTIVLGLSVGATANATTFLNVKTLAIIALGVVAFGIGTGTGVLLAKFMNKFLKTPINPLIGSAGVSAVPMAARVSQVVGQQENPSNFLLMHAMGPNVAGVIGSAVSAGVLLAMYG